MAQPYVKELLGTSEVVLIETRQHWMAAIRFAMRPIIIALVGVGLLVLNNLFSFNDDQFLSVINDLITWAVVILFLISIIWIPIDLIRWDSRRYVLTNRRAMRVEGVLRKDSIDSSLDQITDIKMQETTFGRLLGYADLTLFTASDAANEEYKQLLDGKQFKIAVMDAKEAIRIGGSMDALPEGFIVKGGTNEASMRADGKITDEPEEAPPAAAAPEPEEQQPVTPVPPPLPTQPAPPVEVAPAAEPEPVVAAAAEPEPVAPEPEPEPVSAPEPVAEPALVVEPEPEPEPVEPEPEPEAAEPEPEAAEPEPEPAESEPAAEEALTEGDAAEAAADADATTEEPKAQDDDPKTA